MLWQPWWEGTLSAFSFLNPLRPRRRVLFSVCRVQFFPLLNPKPQFFYEPQLQGPRHKISASVSRSDLLSSIYVYFITEQEESVLVCGKGHISVSRPWWTEIQKVIKLSLWKCLLLDYKYYEFILLLLPWIKTHQVQLSLVPLFDTALPVCKFSFKLAARVFLSTLSQLQLLSLFSAQLIALCQLNWDFCQELWFSWVPWRRWYCFKHKSFFRSGGDRQSQTLFPDFPNCTGQFSKSWGAWRISFLLIFMRDYIYIYLFFFEEYNLK